MEKPDRHPQLQTVMSFFEAGLDVTALLDQVEVEERRDRRRLLLDLLVIHGRGLHGLAEPDDVIDCRNSGTTIRLLSGVLSANPFFSVLTGDDSLRTRPMARVIKPLSLMGAEITASSGNRYPPLAIRGKSLLPLRYEMPISSAQVKSSLLVAGLYADGETAIKEPSRSRDHTEPNCKRITRV